MKTDKFKNVSFESSTRNTPQFNSFYSAFIADVKKILGGDYEVKFSKGHFDVSGFITNKGTGKLAWFRISDVRFFPMDWRTHILIRTAKHDKDFTGGTNYYTSLIGMKSAANNLTN